MNYPNKSKNFTKNIVYVVILVLVGISLFSILNPMDFNNQESSMSEIIHEVNSKNVERVVVENNKVTAYLKESDTRLYTYKEAGVGVNEYGITPENVKIEIKDPNKGDIWPTLLSILLPFGLIALFLYFLLKSTQGANIKAMSFGQTKARMYMGKKKVTFHDVAGLKEAKQELVEVVDFLKNPKKYISLGAEIPKGLLLVGSPGTGKTLLAKAVAGEAGVPFFSLSASEFVEMFVGVGASRVRDLFTKAKRNAPAVIFVDELDAIGRQRGTGLGGSHDEREQTLNQILVEMDGFETDTRVIIMAATNRPDVLDPALLRPGRFDRRVVLNLPTLEEREQILKIHAKSKPIESDVDFKSIASSTVGLAGADLKNIVNEAAILAARENKKTVNQKDLQEAIEKVMMGPEKKSRILSDKERKITAYHETGHAIVGHVLPNTDPIHKVSIVSRGMALGYTWSLPEKDVHLYSKSKFIDEIAQLLSGREAEKIIFGETTTGAENDMKRATKIARNMVTVYGMSDKVGPQSLGERDEMVFLGRELGEHKNYSEKVAALIDDEVKRIVLEGEKRANDILTKYKSKLDEIAKELLDKETIDKKEFNKFFESKK
jgi:cell division protease FtsH